MPLFGRKRERHDCATDKVTIYYILYDAIKHDTIKILKWPWQWQVWEQNNWIDRTLAATRISASRRIGALIVQLYYHESQSNLCPTWQVFWLVPLSHGLPILDGQWRWWCDNLAGLTAAGLLRILTWFPFNPWHVTTWRSRHQIVCKITTFFDCASIFLMTFYWAFSVASISNAFE